MRLAIVGSRDYPNPEDVANTIDLVALNVTEIVSGGARGIDTIAEYLAKENNIPIKIFIPDWGKYGKRAGYLRNCEIVNYCDKLIAFQYKKSRGTQISIDLAAKDGKLIGVFERE